jgi:hypothetical protein
LIGRKLIMRLGPVSGERIAFVDATARFRVALSPTGC